MAPKQPNKGRKPRGNKASGTPHDTEGASGNSPKSQLTQGFAATSGSALQTPIPDTQSAAENPTTSPDINMSGGSAVDASGSTRTSTRDTQGALGTQTLSQAQPSGEASDTMALD